MDAASRRPTRVSRHHARARRRRRASAPHAITPGPPRRTSRACTARAAVPPGRQTRPAGTPLPRCRRRAGRSAGRLRLRRRRRTTGGPAAGPGRRRVRCRRLCRRRRPGPLRRLKEERPCVRRQKRGGSAGEERRGHTAHTPAGVDDAGRRERKSRAGGHRGARRDPRAERAVRKAEAAVARAAALRAQRRLRRTTRAAAPAAAAPAVTGDVGARATAGV